jgi:hypothetical protein
MTGTRPGGTPRHPPPNQAAEKEQVIQAAEKEQANQAADQEQANQAADQEQANQAADQEQANQAADQEQVILQTAPTAETDDAGVSPVRHSRDR